MTEVERWDGSSFRCLIFGDEPEVGEVMAHSRHGYLTRLEFQPVGESHLRWSGPDVWSLVARAATEGEVETALADLEKEYEAAGDDLADVGLWLEGNMLELLIQQTGEMYEMGQIRLTTDLVDLLNP